VVKKCIVVVWCRVVSCSVVSCGVVDGVRDSVGSRLMLLLLDGSIADD
jgi:hypothetical protein